MERIICGWTSLNGQKNEGMYLCPTEMMTKSESEVAQLCSTVRPCGL